MAQLFPAYANTLARAGLAAAVAAFGVCVACGYALYFSPLNTGVGVPVEQPVPFSHAHHIAGLGIDCRYCHVEVETSAFAGIPATETCMTCHSQIWRDAPMLEPVRQSWIQQKPLHWTRVNDLPDYVYFNHGIHVAKGVACVSCHGRMDRMPLTAKGQNLFMRWCLDCHRHPENGIGPPGEVFAMTASAKTPAQAADPSHDVPRKHSFPTPRLEDCSTCHR